MQQHFTNFNRSFILPTVFLFTVFSACSKSDNNSPASTNIDTLNIKYLVNDDLSFTVIGGTTPPVIPPVVLPITVFAYQDGKVVKRTGGIVTSPSGTQYSLSVYDTVIYNGSTITLLTKSSDATITVDPHQRVLLLNNGQITQQTTATDTTFYYYNSGLPSHTETFSKTQQLSKVFTFSGGNLQLIASTCVGRAAKDTIFEQAENFANYDTKPNGLKQLGIWNDLFYRSFTNNNFAATNIVKISNDGSHSTANSSLTIIYKSNGQVDYSK